MNGKCLVAWALARPVVVITRGCPERLRVLRPRHRAQVLARFNIVELMVMISVAQHPGLEAFEMEYAIVLTVVSKTEVHRTIKGSGWPGRQRPPHRPPYGNGDQRWHGYPA